METHELGLAARRTRRDDRRQMQKSPHSNIRSADLRGGRLLVSASYSLASTTSPLLRLGTLGVLPGCQARLSGHS